MKWFFVMTQANFRMMKKVWLCLVKYYSGGSMRIKWKIYYVFCHVQSSSFRVPTVVRKGLLTWIPEYLEKRKRRRATWLSYIFLSCLKSIWVQRAMSYVYIIWWLDIKDDIYICACCELLMKNKYKKLQNWKTILFRFSDWQRTLAYWSFVRWNQVKQLW